MSRFSALAVMLLAGLSAFAPLSSRAADMAAPPVPRTAPAARDALMSYVQERAVLLMIRASFNVVAESDIIPALEDDLRRIGPKGPSVADQIALDDDLTAEASYYLVSLRYTIEAGGAAWPADRSAKSYEADGLARLETLEDQLFADVATGADTLPVLAAAQSIWALTNGERAVGAESDFTTRRDTYVRAALKAAAPWGDA
jgi:hypothetical protein